MGLCTKVLVVWGGLRRRARRIMQSLSRGSPDAVLRCRCQVITGLVPGKSPTTSAAGGLGSASQVSRVAHRLVEQGLAGWADRREDNGQDQVTATDESELLSVLAGSPRDHGSWRPTGTQELVALVRAARTGIGVRVSTLSRLLKRLGVRLGRPQPTVGWPWPEPRKLRRRARMRRLIRGLGPGEVAVSEDEVDIPRNPKIGPDGMLSGRPREVPTPGQNQQRYRAGALDARTAKLTGVEGERKNRTWFLLVIHRLVTVTSP